MKSLVNAYMGLTAALDVVSLCFVYTWRRLQVILHVMVAGAGAVQRRYLPGLGYDCPAGGLSCGTRTATSSWMVASER